MTYHNCYAVLPHLNNCSWSDLSESSYTVIPNCNYCEKVFNLYNLYNFRFVCFIVTQLKKVVVTYLKNLKRNFKAHLEPLLC